MKKLLIVLAAGAALYAVTRKKDSKKLAALPGIQPAVIPVSIASRYEGQCVMNESRANWFLVKGGKKYGFVDFEAYKAAGSPTQNILVDAELEMIPAGGHVNSLGIVVPV